MRPEHAYVPASSGRDVSEVEQIARVRNDDVVGESAVEVRAEGVGAVAEMLAVGGAEGAGAAADPGEDDAAVAGGDAGRIGPGRRDFADDLVAQGEGEFAHGPDVQLSAAAHLEIALPQVQVAVAEATGVDADKHLGARGFGGRPFRRLERPAVLAELVALQSSSSVSHQCRVSAASASHHDLRERVHDILHLGAPRQQDLMLDPDRGAAEPVAYGKPAFEGRSVARMRGDSLRAERFDRAVFVEAFVKPFVARVRRQPGFVEPHHEDVAAVRGDARVRVRYAQTVDLGEAIRECVHGLPADGLLGGEAFEPGEE